MAVRRADPTAFIFFSQSNPGPIATGSYSGGSHGSGNATATFGSVRVFAYAFSDATNPFLGGNYSARGYWDETITINNPGLTGQPGTARISYLLETNTFTVHNDTFGHPAYFDLTLPVTSYNYSSNGGIESGPSPYSVGTVTNDVGFTFGTPFTIHSELSTNLSTNVSTYNGGSASDLADMRLSRSSIEALYGGNTIDYSSTSNSGSAFWSTVPIGSPYSGLSVTNTAPFSNGTVASLIGGTAGTAAPFAKPSGSVTRPVHATFVAPPNSTALASDVVDLSGTESDLFVVQISYDPAKAAALPGGESLMAVVWYNPATSQWVNAVEGNGDLGAVHTHFYAAYNAGTHFVRGYYGIDLANHVVWAVLDHNSKFAVKGVTAPSAAGATVAGRVTTPDGFGLRNAQVLLTDQNGITRTAITSSFGYYTFDDVPAGGSYILTVAAKRYRFGSRLVQVFDSVSDIDIAAESSVW